MTTPVSDLPIIVLAAGQSARMGGQDKLMQQVDGKPLIRRQVDIACAATGGPVLVTVPVAPHPRHAALTGSRARLIEVPDASEGMNASLRAGFAALPAGVPAAMVLLGDLPALELDDLNTVFQAIDLATETLIWRGATDAGKPGHPVVFSARLFNLIAALSGDSGGREVVQAAGDRVELVRLPGHRARLDLDTPEDWAAWRKHHPG